MNYQDEYFKEKLQKIREEKSLRSNIQSFKLLVLVGGVFFAYFAMLYAFLIALSPGVYISILVSHYDIFYVSSKSNIWIFAAIISVCIFSLLKHLYPINHKKMWVILCVLFLVLAMVTPIDLNIKYKNVFGYAIKYLDPMDDASPPKPFPLVSSIYERHFSSQKNAELVDSKSTKSTQGEFGKKIQVEPEKQNSEINILVKNSVGEPSHTNNSADDQVSLVASKPSFDCSKSSNRVEIVICNSAELSNLDIELSEVYKKSLQQSADKNNIKRIQLQWIKDIQRKCIDELCLVSAYRQQISLIKEYNLTQKNN